MTESNKNLKILFSPCHYIYDDNKWGSEISWAFNIADKTASKYTDSIVVTGSNQIESAKKYQIYELLPKNKSLDLSILNSLKFNLLYSLKTFRIIRSQKIDLIHHVLPFSINNTFNFSLIIRNKSIPAIIGPVQSSLSVLDKDIGSGLTEEQKTVSSKNNNRFLQYLFSSLLKALSRATLKSATRVIAINDFTKNILTKSGIEENKIVVIPPGIDTKIFHIHTKGISQKKTFTLISTSKLLYRKQIDLIIDSVGKCIDSNTPVQLMIVGDGPQRSMLEKQVINSGLGNYIKFYGYVPQNRIASLYSKADMFVSMSLDESWGQVYLEAMSCGLPILTTENNGSKEIVVEGKYGFFINHNDSDDLTQKIRYCVSNPTKLNEMHKNVRSYVLGKYDWDTVIIPNYQKLYKSLVLK